jgi:hypothetical protein
MYISAIDRQNMEDELEWESHQRHRIAGGFITYFRVLIILVWQYFEVI